MSEDGPGEGNHKTLTRREFLKMMRNATLAAAISPSKVIADLTKPYPQKETQKSTSPSQEVRKTEPPTTKDPVQEQHEEPQRQETPPGLDEKAWAIEQKRTNARLEAAKKKPLLKQRPTSELTNNVSAEITTLPDPEEIGGYETWGHSEGLTEEQFQELVYQLNEADQLTMEDGIYYSTVVVKKSIYDSAHLEIEQDDTFQSFAARHSQKMSELLAESNSLVPGHENEQLLKGIQIRRFIVVKDGVVPPYQASPILDSDGFTGAWMEADYNPKTSPYWNEELQLDLQWIHEDGHTVLQLPDEHRLNLPTFNEISNSLQGLPPEWRQYWYGWNSDKNPSLMNSVEPRLSPYVAWLLAHRLLNGRAHDPEANFPEIFGFPKALPTRFTIHLGAEYAGKPVTICRSSEGANGIYMLELPLNPMVDENGHLDIGNPFNDLYQLPFQLVLQKVYLCSKSVITNSATLTSPIFFAADHLKVQMIRSLE